MILKIKHHTNYQYPTPIFPEPQHLYFTPLSRGYLNIIDFKLEVNPKPTGNAIRIDIEGNPYNQCWFNELTDHLEINVEIELELDQLNQFDFLVEEAPKTEMNKAVDLYLKDQLSLKKESVEWLKTIENNDPISFIGSLCQSIHDKWDHTTSYDTELLDPNKCFDFKAASCRDLAWMMIQMLRHVGYPARFVSGYSYNPELTGHELHAWVEVWVHGAGWIGVDPSSGLFITEFYIPIAASYHPTNTLPVQGSYRGSAPSELTTSIDLQVKKRQELTN
ncbi:MAG: transglutaminase family protein [Fulvivirga sp.]|uniref:transglutaminase family protein n=1 Tax=Fulvivirga sp. TaxID=1931237 RepID=UPI0032F0489F